MEGRVEHAVHRGPLREDRILLQGAHPHARRALHDAPVGVKLPGQEFQQRALPRPVAPDKAHAVAGLHGEGHVLHDGQRSIFLTGVHSGNKHAPQYRARRFWRDPRHGQRNTVRFLSYTGTR